VDSRTGNIYVTGTSASTDPLDSGYATLAYSATGTSLWTKRYDSPAGLAVDPVRGRVYVLFTADGPGGPAAPLGYTTLAYSTR